MATYSAATFDFDLSTDANYRALWGAVDTQLQGLGGWTYVSQTGDSDPAAATTGSVGTYPSWRVYSTDVNGETWYMRLDYGHTSAGPAYKHQLGSSVNGSGVLGGQTSTQLTQIFVTTVTSGGATRRIYLSTDDGRISFHLNVASAGNGSMIGLSVHGGVDSAGDLDSGIELWGFHNNGNYMSQRIPVSGVVPPQVTGWMANFSNVANQTLGSHTMTGHPFLWEETGGQNVTPAVAIVGSSNGTPGLTTSIDLYGVTRTFLVTAQAWPAVGSNCLMCLLYE
jgi:hypothetical protein